MNLYMHTINGRPAQYHPDTGYICFAKVVTRLERSLADIKKQRAAVEKRDEMDGADFEYDYVRIRASAVNGEHSGQQRSEKP